jgi:hypothetical protein
VAISIIDCAVRNCGGAAIATEGPIDGLIVDGLRVTEPTRRDDGDVNWTKIGALAGVVSAFIALIGLLVTVLIA